MNENKDRKTETRHGYLRWPTPDKVAGFTGIPATPEIVYHQEAPSIRPKRGRNEECWCGSGKKYKKCHLNDDQRQA
jgi:uncharacterized protein YecA (UPF0149 family)